MMGAVLRWDFAAALSDFVSARRAGKAGILEGAISRRAESA
jgi:hypothetical protein